jgi:hypothetical protein
MDDALARHLVDQGHRLFERGFRRRLVLAVDGRAHALQRAAQAGSELSIVLAVFDTLSMRFERRLMRSQRLFNLRNP